MRALGDILRSAVAVCTAFAVAFGLTGCRQSDFLKDVVFAAWATIVDERAPIVVNNPDAQQASEDLPAYDLDDVETETKEKQTIVVYSSDPNTPTVSTRHSVFDLSPRFRGVEASDEVRLAYGKNTQMDKDIDDELLEKLKAHAATSGKSDKDSEKEAAAGDAADSSPAKGDAAKKKGASGEKRRKGKASGSDGSGAGSGKKGSGASGKKGKGGSKGGSAGKKSAGSTGTFGDGGDGDDGRSARESGGYDGEDITYDPGNRLEKPAHSGHVAAIGQAAVVAQAVGGKGALAAMDAYTYKGLGENGKHDVYASSFSEVFADELADGFGKSALLWKKDGMAPKNLKSTEDLVAACADKETGKGGTILFCSDRGSQADYFSSPQLAAFKDAGIQLVPLDMSSPQGIVDAFAAVGEVLSESTEIEQDAQENAEAFRSIFNKLVKAATGSRKKDADDGTVAVESEGSKSVYSDYYEADFGTRFSDVWASIADGYGEYAAYTGPVPFDMSRGTAFSTGDVGKKNSPLSLFMQASGVVHLKAASSNSEHASSTTLLSPVNKPLKKKDFAGYDADSPFARMDSSGLMDAGHWSIGDNVATGSDGIGSSIMPYLIVASSAQATGTQVKQALVAQQSVKKSIYHLYEAGGSQPTMSDILSLSLTDDSGKKVELHSALGCQHDYAKSIFHDKGVELADCIRVNPCGLIGNWTLGTPESVLESAWLVELYSKYPKNSDYAQNLVDDKGKFSVKIGGEELADAQAAIEAFYKAVYRCDVERDLGLDYRKIVPDSGEGLKAK